MKDLSEKVLAVVGGAAILGAIFLVPYYDRKHELEKLNCREVPCCRSLLAAVEQAVAESGKQQVIERIVLGIDGKPK